MKFPELSNNVKEFMQYALKRSKYTEGIIYIGDYNGGFVFTYKKPKEFKDMCWGMPKFLYVKDDIVYAINDGSDNLGADNVYSKFMSMLDPDNEDKFYTITLDSENK